MSKNCSDAKIAYLEMIQATISRMATMSSVVKGFTATIVAGLLALSFDSIDGRVAWLIVLPVCGLMILDTFYLVQEKRYRELYNKARKEDEASFEMDAGEVAKTTRTWFDAIKSPSIWLFYVPMIAALFVMAQMKAGCP